MHPHRRTARAIPLAAALTSLVLAGAAATTASAAPERDSARSTTADRSGLAAQKSYVKLADKKGRKNYAKVDLLAFNEHNEHRMSFQLILTNANGCGSGDFDVEFRYNRCEWDTGTASGDENANGVCDTSETSLPLPAP